MTDAETQDRIAAVREYARALEAWIAELAGRRVERQNGKGLNATPPQ